MKLLQALVLVGAALVVAAPLVVYTHYPAAASDAAHAASGSPPFEGAVSAASGYREASVSGVLESYAVVRGHCILLLETPRGRLFAVMAKPYPWQWGGHAPVAPCHIASRLVGSHVVARGYLMPGPRGPVLVVAILDTPLGPARPATPHPWGYWGSTGSNQRHAGRPGGCCGGWSG